MITYILHRYIIGNVKICFFSVIPAKPAKGLLKKLGNRNDLVKIVIRNKTSFILKVCTKKEEKNHEVISGSFLSDFRSWIKKLFSNNFFLSSEKFHYLVWIRYISVPTKWLTRVVMKHFIN